MSDEERDEIVKLVSAKTENQCKDFIFNEIDAFFCGDLNKKYKPRVPVMKQCEGQASLF